MTEGQVSVQTGGAPDGVASSSVSEVGTKASGAEISPEVQAMIDAKAKEVREAMQLKYEGTGGKIAEIQSKYDKLLKDERAKREMLLNQRLQEAEALMDRDPARAAEIALEQAKMQIMQSSTASEAEQIREWVQVQYRDMGLDMDDEKVAGQAAKDYEKLMEARRSEDGGQAAAMAFQKDLGRRAAEHAREETASLAKEFSKYRDELPSLIRTEMARQGVAGGLDLGQPGGAKADTDFSTLSATRNISEGLKARQAQAKKVKPPGG